MADSATRPRSFAPSSILERPHPVYDAAANATAADADAPLLDKTDPLPGPGDAYRAHGRVCNKRDVTIDFVLKDFTREGFSYADYERVRLAAAATPGGGDVMTVRFHGSTVTDVVIEGRNLDALYHHIGRHRMPWLWEHPSPARFTDANATIITRITFQEVER